MTSQRALVLLQRLDAAWRVYRDLCSDCPSLNLGDSLNTKVYHLREARIRRYQRYLTRFFQKAFRELGLHYEPFSSQYLSPTKNRLQAFLVARTIDPGEI